MKEIWKDIKGYEGLYQISNLGRIKSISRFINNCKSNKLVGYFCKETIKKQTIGKTGYYVSVLYKNGKGKMLKTHRIIAEAFIPNPNKLPIINHKDGNKLNNKIENLEWCTYSHNNKEAYKQKLKNNNLKWIKECNKRKRKKVRQIDINNNFIREWEFIQQAEKELKICHINIIKVCKGERKTAGGYKWEYV